MFVHSRSVTVLYTSGFIGWCSVLHTGQMPEWIMYDFGNITITACSRFALLTSASTIDWKLWIAREEGPFVSCKFIAEVNSIVDLGNILVLMMVAESNSIVNLDDILIGMITVKLIVWPRSSL